MKGFETDSLKNQGNLQVLRIGCLLLTPRGLEVSS